MERCLRNRLKIRHFRAFAHLEELGLPLPGLARLARDSNAYEQRSMDPIRSVLNGGQEANTEILVENAGRIPRPEVTSPLRSSPF